MNTSNLFINKLPKKLLARSLLAVLSTSSVVASAGDHGGATPSSDLTANIGITSNYLWRGVTQSNDTAAISGGVDYEHHTGFYAGIWVSSVDFSGGNAVGEYEADTYIGYANDINDFHYSVELNRYNYPDNDGADADFTELLFNVSFQYFFGGAAITIESELDDDVDTFVEEDVYYHVGAALDLRDQWNISLLYGYYDFENDSSSNETSYGHIQADLTKSTENKGNFTIGMSKADDESGDDDAKLYVSWTLEL